jgi:hypothetical protein
MRRFRWIAFVFSCLTASPGLCSTASSGVVNLWAPSGATVALGTAGVRSTLPSCAAAGDGLWIVTVGGTNETLISSMLSAYMAAKPFEVIGTGTCDSGGREYIAYIVSH